MKAWHDIADRCEFDALVLRAEHPLVVVAFEDRDCGHCRAHRQLLSLAWRQLGLQLTTLRVDAGRLSVLAQQYRILGYPTLLVFTAGEVVERYPGRRAPKHLTARLTRLSGTHGTERAADPRMADVDGVAL
jgi:thioredoxin-like negative regulator of GroEL